ncbi:hypothetical protein L289_3883 [Acinetobacter gerneri DSM 14967 = CIP 107464 = MTCC 9824]|nr:hypothetical protein L289_3883 [Acinetobacter gerneri DSM 14967 = CIP 107464 = MTCC 9824]
MKIRKHPKNQIFQNYMSQPNNLALAFVGKSLKMTCPER